MVDAQVVEGAARALLHFVWQGALITAVLGVVLWAIGPRPALRHAAASAGLIASCIVFALTLGHGISIAIARAPSVPATATSMTVGGSTPSSSAADGAGREAASTRGATARSDGASRNLSAALDTARTAASATLDAVPRRHATVVVGAWALGVMALAVRLAGGALVVRRLRTRGIVPVPAPVDATFRRLRSALGVGHPVALRASSLVDVPTVLGLARPLVLLPAAAISGMPLRHLECMLAHELAHLHRGDLLVNALQRLAETILFFHPAIWWMSAVATRAREHAADELAVAAIGGDRGGYAAALLSVATTARGRPLALGAADGDLVARVRHVLTPAAPTRSGPAAALVALALAVAVTASASAVRAEAAPAPTTTLWATMTPGVRLAGDGTWIVLPGNFAALEERVDGVLVRRVVLVPDGAATALPPVPHPMRRWLRLPDRLTYLIQEGPAAARSDTGTLPSASADWFDATFQGVLTRGEAAAAGSAGSSTRRFVDEGGRFVSVFVGHAGTGTALTDLHRTIGDWRTSSAQAPYGPFVGLADTRSAVALAAHALAHGVDDEQRVAAYLLDVMRVVERIGPDLAADILRTVPAFADDRFKGLLVEAVAVTHRSLGRHLAAAFDDAVAAIENPHIAGRAATAFDEGFPHLWPDDLAPIWFVAGTATGRSPASPDVGTYLAIGTNFYVGAFGRIPFTVTVAGGQTLWREVIGEGMPNRFHNVPLPPPGDRLTVTATIHDQVHEITLSIDPSERLPIAGGVDVAGTPTRPVVRWRPVPGAAHYEIVLRHEDGTSWLFRTTTPSLDLGREADELGAGLDPGRYDIVAVTAFSEVPDACPACQVNTSTVRDGLPSFEVR